MRISELEQVAFEHHYKKILSKILRVGSGMAAPANESKDWPPIIFAKLVERFARFLLFTMRAGARKNYAPACRSKSVRPVMRISDCLGVHRYAASYLRNSCASEKRSTRSGSQTPSPVPRKL